MIEPPVTEQANLQQAQQPMMGAAASAAGQYVRPTHVARARNHCLVNALWLLVAVPVGVRALAEPALSTAWIAVVVALAAVWLAVDAVGARVVDRVVLSHDHVGVRVHTARGIDEFEIVADARIEIEHSTSRHRRHRCIELQWPHDGPHHTIRLDVFGKHDQAKILRRISELTTRR